MSISRQLAELMGGTLTVASTEGQGSVFRFTARLKKLLFTDVERLREEDQEQASSPKSAAINQLRAQSRILVVEDNPTNQKVALALLEKAGFGCTLVSSGYEALQRMEDELFDLVLMDCQMPGLDGYETTSLIRSRNVAVLRHDIPIIAMTANALEGDRDKCLEAGMDDYLSKPIEINRLVTLLEKWLSLEGIAAERGNPTGRDGDNPVTQSATLEPPVFNEDDYMNRNLGDRELARDVLNMFVSSTPGYLAALQEQLEKKDQVGIRMQAHTIKGACATVGAELMRVTAQRLEQLAREGELAAAVSVAARLVLDYQRLKEELGRRGWLQQ